MGAHLTNIVIHNHGIPKVVRTVTRGGDELTRRLAERLGISLAEAEQAKCEVGLTGCHREVSRRADRGDPAAAGRDPQLHPLLRLDQRRRADRTDLAHRRRLAAARPGRRAGRADRGSDQRRHPDAAHPQPVGVQAGADRGRRRTRQRGVGRPGDGSSSMTAAIATSGQQLWSTMPGWGIVADLTPPELIASRRLRLLRKLLIAGAVRAAGAVAARLRLRPAAGPLGVLGRWPTRTCAPCSCRPSRPSTAR